VGSDGTVDFTHAIIQATTPGAIYKGLAFAGNGSAHFLYATDFHNNKIDVFDKSFGPVALGGLTIPGNFVDSGLPSGFAPFGIQHQWRPVCHVRPTGRE
jgi:hypothetical protein